MKCNVKGGNGTRKCKRCQGKMKLKGRYWECTKCRATEHEEETNMEKAWMKYEYENFW